MRLVNMSHITRLSHGRVWSTAYIRLSLIPTLTGDVPDSLPCEKSGYVRLVNMMVLSVKLNHFIWLLMNECKHTTLNMSI